MTGRKHHAWAWGMRPTALLPVYALPKLAQSSNVGAKDERLSLQQSALLAGGAGGSCQ